MSRADYPQPIQDLIAELKRLPGVGPRSAERMAVWMIQHKKRNPLELAQALSQAESSVTLCSACGFFSTDEGCTICDDHGRDEKLVCVVEQATDVLPLERSGAFTGYYHCLGGKLSPLDNVTPSDLRINQLLKRVESLGEIEVILHSVPMWKGRLQPTTFLRCCLRRNVASRVLPKVCLLVVGWSMLTNSL